MSLVEGSNRRLDFKKEFNLYRKEALRIASLEIWQFFFQHSKKKIIHPSWPEIDKLQSAFKVEWFGDYRMLKTSKNNSQYVTELDYAAQAVRDETNAKLRLKKNL